MMDRWTRGENGEEMGGGNKLRQHRALEWDRGCWHGRRARFSGGSGFLLWALDFSPRGDVLCGTLLWRGFLRRCGLFVFGAEFLPKVSIGETLEITVPDRPLCPAKAAVARRFAETNGCGENVSNGVHPSGFVSMKIWIDNGDPVVDFL